MSQLKLSQWENSLKYLLRLYALALLYALMVALFVRTFIVSAYRVSTHIMAPTLLPGDFILGYKLPFGISLPFADESLRWGGRSPVRGELVVLTCPDRPEKSCLRRVIGLPGDRIEMRGKRLILNGHAAQYQKVGNSQDFNNSFGFFNKGEVEGFVSLREIGGDKQYLICIGPQKDRENIPPLVVPPGHLWVLSDNRDLGEDSRDWGVVSVRKLEAKALFVWISLGWKRATQIPTKGSGEENGYPEVRWHRIGRRLY